MLNKQLPSRVTLEDSKLAVHSIFETIQGEGPFAGTPALFLRLAGCNIQCPGCDTEYTNGARDMDITELWDRLTVILERGKSRILVITGGEPLRQAAALINLIDAMHSKRIRKFPVFPIQIETNGTLPMWDTSEQCPFRYASRWSTHYVVSPKGNLHPFFNQWYMDGFNIHFKYVVKAGQINEEDGLPTQVLERRAYPGRPTPAPADLELTPSIWVQPMDEQDPEKNAKNAEAAVSSCLKHGYRLTMQLHKLVNLP